MNRILLLSGLASAFCLGVFADSIVILPGAGSTERTAQVYSTDTLNARTTLSNAPAGAFELIPKPDGTKYYLIASAGGTGVSVVDQSFTNVRSIASAIGVAPSLAAMSPDGSRLLVIAADRVYAFDTETDALVGSPITFSGSPKDITFTIDSTKAFVLANDGSTGSITPIDLATSTAGSPVRLDSPGISITCAPNGLLYATMANRFQEYDPGTLAKSAAGAISVFGLPQKPVFTPDGKFAFSIDGQHDPSALIYEFDLVNRNLAGVTPAENVEDADVEFSNLYAAGDERIFAYAASQASLYEIRPGSAMKLAAKRANLPSGLPYNAIRALAFSREDPAASGYFIAAVDGRVNLYKADFAAGKIADPGEEFPAWDGRVLRYVDADANAEAASIIAVAAPPADEQASWPLVVRVVDAQGRPVFNARVDFTTATEDVVLTPVTAYTNSDGYAQTFLTAPADSSTISVTANAAGLETPATIDITPADRGGCSTGCAGPTIAILSGNGLLMGEGFASPELLMVELKDGAGHPLGGQEVTFQITKGVGSLVCPAPDDSAYPYVPDGACGGANATLSTLSVITDALGRAGVVFRSASVTDPHAFQETLVQATSNAGAVLFHETTFISNTRADRPAFPPAVYIVDPNPRVLQGGVGELIRGAIKVQVTSLSGAGPADSAMIENAGVHVDAAPGSNVTASCGGGLQLTDSSGLAVCDLRIGNKMGQGALRITVGGAYQFDIALTVTKGPPANIEITAPSKGAASAAPGEQIPLQIRVTDAAGNAVSGAPLAWTVSPDGAATVSSASKATDSNGAGRATLALGASPAAIAVKVTAGEGEDAPSVIFNIAAGAPVGGIAIGSGDQQTAATGAPFEQPLVVEVSDPSGGPANGAVISFVVTSGDAVLSAATATTSANGQASISVTAGSTAGPVVVTASAGDHSVVFHLTASTSPPVTHGIEIRNAASGVNGLAPCGIGIISGTGIAAGIDGVMVAKTSGGELPTTFTSGGYSATIRVGDTLSPIYWVSNTREGGEQIAFQTPCETAPGVASVTVSINGSEFTVADAQVAKYQPAIFETVFNGKPYAALLHADRAYPNLVNTTVTPENPAHQGELIRMYATGLGPVTPATATNQPGVEGQMVVANVIVAVNNVGVRVVSAEYLPGQTGMYAIRFQVPADAEVGGYQNLALILTDPDDPDATFIYANGSFIAIASK